MSARAGVDGAGNGGVRQVSAAVCAPLRRAGSGVLMLELAIAAVMLAAPGAAPAHHSFAMFDANQTSTALVSVKEFQWGNPHTWLEVVVPNEDGTLKPLSLELTGLSGLRRYGWKPGTLRPGDKVTVTYHPMRDGSPAGQLVQAVTADGQTLMGQ